MDTNNPTPVTPAPTPQPTPTVIPEPPAPQASSSGRLVTMLIIGLVVLALVIALFYWYSINQKTTSKSATTTQDLNNINKLETDLNGATLDDLDSDLSAVDTDLKSL